MRKRAEWMMLGLLLVMAAGLGLAGHWHGVVVVLALGLVLEIGAWIDRRLIARGHHRPHDGRASSEAADGDPAEAPGEGSGGE